MDAHQAELAGYPLAAGSSAPVLPTPIACHSRHYDVDGPHVCLAVASHADPHRCTWCGIRWADPS